jgi:hypothetical protein
METITAATCGRTAWNKGKLIGQKSPLKLKEIWAIRIRLQPRMSNARTGVIQPGDRQQVTRLRSGQPSRSRCNTGYACSFARDRYAEEDETASSVRAYRTNA